MEVLLKGITADAKLKGKVNRRYEWSMKIRIGQQSYLRPLAAWIAAWRITMVRNFFFLGDCVRKSC